MEVTDVVVAEKIEATPESLVMHVGGRVYRLAWASCSPRLAAASEEARLRAELSPGGYGIHWPMIDEDLSVSGLLRSAE